MTWPLGVSVIACVIGEYSFMRWAKMDSTMSLASGFVAYFVSSCFWALHLKRYAELGRSAAIWDALSVVVAVGIGVMFFGEKPTLVERCAYALIVGGMILLSARSAS